MTVWFLATPISAQQEYQTRDELKSYIQSLLGTYCQGIKGCMADKNNKFSALPPEAANIMIEIYEENGNPNTIYWLGHVDSEESFEYLTQLIRKRVGTGAAFSAAFTALSFKKDDPRVFEFAAAYLNDPAPGVRKNAAGTLGRLSDERAIPLLEDLYDDPDIEVRRLAPKLVEMVKKDIEQSAGRNVSAILRHRALAFSV